jgi:hypothetical protein
MLNEKDQSIEKRFPEEIPFPHLIDNIFEKDESKRNITLLNDIAGFILSFIVMGVDTEKHLPNIVLSEYDNISKDEVNKEIKDLMLLLEKMDYLVPREKMPLPRPPEGLAEFKVTTKSISNINFAASAGNTTTIIRRAH